MRWSWQTSQLASHSSLKTYVQITFTESYICLLLCCHHSLGRHLLPITKLLHVGHICQSLLNKDIWIETATLGQDLCTLVKPEVDTCFIQMILSLFGALVVFFLLSILQLRIHISSSSFFLTGQGNNVILTFSVLWLTLNSKEKMKTIYCCWYYHSTPKLNAYFHLMLKFSLLATVEDPKFSTLSVVHSVLI